MRSQEVWSTSDDGTQKKPPIAHDSGGFATLNSIDQPSLTSVERTTLPQQHEAKRVQPAPNALQGEEGQPMRTHDSGTATLRTLSPDTDVVDTVATISNNEAVLAVEGGTRGPTPTMISREENDRVLSGSNMKYASSCPSKPAMESPMVSLIYLTHENESVSDIDLQSSLGSTESVSSNS